MIITEALSTEAIIILQQFPVTRRSTDELLNQKLVLEITDAVIGYHQLSVTDCTDYERTNVYAGLVTLTHITARDS